MPGMSAAVAATATGNGEPAWRIGFRSLEVEHAEPVALPVVGRIPPECFGTLYRNGPARHVVFGEPLQHWFDGDGMIHAFVLGPDGASYRNRFVASAGREAENAARHRIFRTFSMPPAGGLLTRYLRRAKGKNAANTNVLMHAGTLFALWEGGKPTRLDPVTLATLGEDDLDGLLREDEGCSAHPRVDARTGEWWNFTSLFGRENRTAVLRRDAARRTTRVADLLMPHSSMAHDFALTDRYAVLLYCPMVLPRIPILLMLGQRGFAQCLSWKPELGTKIVLQPRTGGAPRMVSTDPRYIYHVIHSFDDGDDVVVDVCAYTDDAVMRTHREVLFGPIHTPTMPRHRCIMGTWVRSETPAARHHSASTTMPMRPR